MILSCEELCSRLDLARPPAPWPDVAGVSTLENAGGADLCFAETAEQHAAVEDSQAALVLVPMDFPEVAGTRVLRVPEPRGAFFSVAETFEPDAEFVGVHPSASIHETALLAEGVAVAPGAVIAAGARVGEGAYIGPGAYIGSHVSLGRDCRVHANVTVQRDTAIGDRCLIHPGASIGGDGFGFRWDGKVHRKVPQLGRVVIEDDVEIGSNVCVDRATLGVTRIGRGTKIDNLVQVAHNVDIGEQVILVSQCGVAGSTSIGSGTVVAGQAAISDHLEIGAGARIGGQAGVTKNVAPGDAVTGTPARALGRNLREQAALGHLPELKRELRRQRLLIEALEARLAKLEAGGDPC